MRTALYAVALLAVVGTATAIKGVDVSSITLPAAFKCLSQNGYDFAVIRAWMETGQPDPASPHTLYNAWNGGMKDVDVYLFPASSPTGQVAGLVNYLRKYNITNRSHYGPPHTFGMLWLDIEAPQVWSRDQGDNQNFIQTLINEAHDLGIALGIYTSESQWVPIVGSWTGGSSFPLWYAHYDNNPSFSDFTPFGGWSHPAIKQYTGTSSVCGASIDNDWYPP